MTWILKDDKNVEQDYKHFDPPFLLAVDDLLSNIRNLTVRYLPDGTLFPINVSQYDPWVMRENTAQLHCSSGLQEGWPNHCC